jgi:exo-beta-1,3-glucanase (GH17 family)/cellulose synthase/poly-beta-1,6-N-acetylglucosamine synthase-like glycosyltransferase
MPQTRARIAGLLIAAGFAALTFVLWAAMNRPKPEPPWPARIQGFAFSPFAQGEDPALQRLPSEDRIERDLALLAGKTNAVRTYSSLGSLSAIPRLADKYDINVALGAWIDSNRASNERELDGAISLARTHRNVVRVLIGNEVILRGDVPLDEMYAYLDRARAAIHQPVGTAEPWHVWLSHPGLADHVDFIAIHLLPYWEGVPVESAVTYSLQRFEQVRARFPGKPIIIGEVGWPSNGRTREGAVASMANEALFLRRFLERAEAEGYIYYLMEAFDQPFKAAYEGAVGAYWGVYDVDRQPKFEFTAPIVRVPQWQVLATVSVLVALFILALLYLNSATLRKRGRSFLAVIVFPTTTIAVWVFYQFTQQYFTATSVIIGVLLCIGMIGVIAVLLAEAHEWAEAQWVVGRRRLAAQLLLEGGASRPKVSIHVPAYNEPPDMLNRTLDALARLDYPDFEVLVIDNNTQDEAVWRPVEAHCAALGPRFRFFHVAPLAGFKAGALNFALAHTAPDVEVVAVIDSDYVVDPGWLHDLAPCFTNRQVGIVQAPQDYSDGAENAFKAMCYAEYRGFFHIGMVTRNERNAIIQHGTMTMVRRSLLGTVGGWAEWCITEDAELGLRVFEAGYEAVYTPKSYGRGLIPDTFVDFKKQRFRWAYGAMQILKEHADLLFSGGGVLTTGQRYHFIAGWLPWVADGFNVLFNLAAIGWSVAMIHSPGSVDPPLAMFAVLPLSLFTFKLAKLLHLYQARVGAGWRQTIAAAIAGLALSHTIGLAVVKGLFTRNEPFFRTPKQAAKHRVRTALNAAREEALIMLALWLCAWGVAHTPQMDSPDRLAWIIVLLIQSVPYAAAIVTSLVSAFELPARLMGGDRAWREPASSPM